MDIRSRLGQDGVVDMVMRQQQEWKQRVEEMSDGRVTKMVYNGDIPGSILEEDQERAGEVILTRTACMY